MSTNFRNRFKFGKISRKDILCTKMQKKGYRRIFFIGALGLTDGWMDG